MHEAAVISLRSLCSRDQVGAVIVDVNQRVIAQGYNGPPSGFPHNGTPCIEWCERSQNGAFPKQRDYADCPALHAEANALMVCDRRDREGGTIYTTSGICWGCAKLIANSGLKFVVVQTWVGQAPHRNCQASYDFLTSCGLVVTLATR